MVKLLKQLLFTGLATIQVDRLFRHLNRTKLLVLMYHGVTRTEFHPPVWTQLPVADFRRHMEFIAANYRVIHLNELLDCLSSGKDLPEKPALITFDDGLRNNYAVAFPVLRQMGLPATIFLTADFMGTDQVFWFDELYLILKQAAGRKDIPLPDEKMRRHLAHGNVWEAYLGTVETLKRAGTAERELMMAELAEVVEPKLEAHLADFGMLSWEQIREMHQSGLVEFGAHTSRHKILTELEESEWHREMVACKMTIEKEVSTEVKAFCFPNGRHLLDFNQKHKDYLQSHGYYCAFSTENQLFNLQDGDRLAIGRVPAGHDETSRADFFRLYTSGVIQTITNTYRK